MDEKYLQDLYEWIKKNDSSYEGRYDYNQFKQKMQDETYASKMHEWIGGIDNTFTERRPLNNFLQLVKGQQQQPVQQEPAKKKELSASLLEGGFSDFLKSEQPQQEYKPTTAVPGTDYNAPQNAPIVFTGQQEEDPYGIKRMEQQMFGEGGTAMPKGDYFAQVGAKEKKEAKVGLEYAIAKEETKKLQQKEQTDLDKKLAENLAIKQSPEFANSLNKIDQSIYTQDDYINNLNREYQKYGVTVTKGGWWGEKLIARTDDGKKMIEINTLIEDPNERSKDLNSLKKFISENAKISKEEDFLSQALRAKNMRSTARINDDGTQSTVKFISFDNKVIPTLFPKTDKWYESYSSDKKDWIELPFDEALKEATKRGEVFTFKTNEEAEAFAKGAWKDISKLDVEGDKFYRSKGRDYITEKKRWERYDEIDDIINFYEGDQKDMAEFKKQNPTLFVNGMFRTDIDQYIGDLKKERESLRPLVKDMTFFSQEGTSEKSRMDFDFHLAEMQKKASSDAAAMVREAKAKVAQSNQESMEIFGVPIDKLTEDKEAMRKNPQAYVKAVSDYTNALMLGQNATIKYTEAQTYFDAKINKDINNRFTEDGEAVYYSIKDGYNNGLIGDQLLALTIPGYSATSGFSSKEDAAKYIAEKLAGMSQTQSRVMTRLESAKTARDWWDVMMDDPFEGMALAVSGSISQMLPYGTKITAATTAAGAGTGALFGLAGGPFAPVTVTGGAVSGGLYGLRTGQAITGYATEYTTAVMDAVRNQGYNPLDPKSLEAALNDQDVWDEGAKVGAARGIPIAIVDYLTAGFAGNILKPSKLASRGTKISRGIAENVVLDPLMESGGELAAQTSEMALGTGRKELSWSEIALEGIGSMGTNTPNFLVNTYKNAKENTDIDLAYSLTNARNVAKEKVSDERISTWANNMLKLGKIDESVNQRIQENVGLRRSAKEVLSVGEQKGKASPEVTARTMELLSAKEQLSATKNRQEVYGQEIRAINEELAAIGKSKQIPAKEQQVNLEGLVELVPESERGAVGEYMIDGKRYTKQQFLDRLNSIKPERLSRVKIAIKGDPEVSQTFKEKIDAIQKQAAGEVSVQPEAGAGQEVEVGGPEAKPKITPEESKRKEDLLAALEATDKDVIAIGDELLDRKEAQAELEAITQKEQAAVTEQGGMEQTPAKGAVEKKDIQVYRGTSTGNRSEKDGVSYYTPDRGYASFYETGKEKPENKALEELESLKTPTKPSKIELSTNEEIDAYVDDYISMAEDAKKFKPETKIPSREEAISELKKQNQIFTTQEEVDNANNKQDEKYNSDLEKYNQRKSELEDEAKNYLSPKKLSGNFFSLGIDFSKMNPQQIFEKLKSLGISSEFKGGNFLDNYHSDLVEFARKNNIDFYDGITGGVQGSMNVAPQEIIEISKIEQAPTAEVTPTKQFTEQDRARKAELEDAMRKADKRRKNITVGETTMSKTEAKAELDALNQKEQATQQPVIPAVEAAPTTTAPTETAPVETMTAEQEADLLEELMTGKKKETAPVEPTSKEAIAKRLRGKKNKGLMSSIDFGISQALYNGALEFMASQVEKNTKLGNAIANTIKWIDEKMQGKKWNKGAFGKYMNDTYKVTLGDGRQVDVLRDDSKETAEVINGWYQPIEQRIIDSKQDKQPANKWAEQLRSKEDEDLWTGVREFLESKGNQSVSKKELLDFMKDNRVEIVEVVKGGSQISLDEAKKIFIDKGYSVITDSNGDTYVEKNEELYDYEDMSKDEQEAFKVLTGQNLDSLSSKDDTKYFQYQLPGDKSNYKEVLVTMPPPQSKTPLSFKEEDGLWNVYRDGKKILEGIDSLEEAKDLVDFGTDSDVTSSGQDVSKVFKSTHFDEPNILVHLRMNTRTDADGNKVLFLEEIQSDWGQEGKKKGFVPNEKERQKIKDKIKDKFTEYDKLPNSEKWGVKGDSIQFEISELNQQLSKLGYGSIEAAPFVTDTNSWVKLGLKMALREAVAQGADKIAWTTGEQQNERYDLSKQVNKIDVEAVAEADGLYFVDIELSSGTTENLEVENGVIRGGAYSGQRLEAVIGKEYADKILSTPKGESVTLQGQDLKLGGKGMKGFYDGIIPGVAKALLKEVTGQEGKITEVNIEGNTQQAIDVTPEMKTQAKTALPLFSGSLADAVRKNLTIKTGGLQSNILGVPIAIWNAGVLTAAKAIDASVAASKAIQQGVNDVKNWIKKNNPSLSLSDAKIKNKILIDLYEGTIKTARENNVKTEGLITYFKRKGLSDAQIDVLLKDEKKKAEKPELSEETLPGYTKLMNRINDIIARGRRNGKTDDDIMKGVIANVESRSPEYANATDQQREQIIRDIRKLFGKKEKAAPSAAKITGKAKPKKVTVDEMTALKDQLRLEAKAAREAKGDLNTKRKMLADAINKMAKKGSISVRQAKAIVNRISSVNLDNPVMVERLLDYAENIFNDADYDTRIQEVRKLQDKVKKVNHVSMKQTVKEFASINPERIPANKLLEYIQALDDMSTRTPFYQKMNDMFDEVMSYKSESKEFDEIKTLQALNDKLESIEINKVKSVEDYVALIRDINSFKKKAYQLLQEGVITKEEYDEVIDNVGKDQAAVEKKYEKELAALKEKLIQEINGLKPKVHPDFTPEEAALINKYLELSDADLASLSPEDLYILNDLLSNIKEDLQLDYFRLSEIVSKAYTNSGGQKLATQINASKFNKSSDQGKKLLAEYEASFWEGLLGLGRATSGALQKFVVAPFTRAIASYENYLKESYSDFLKLKKKYNMKDYNMHRLGILTTYLQEYMAQFDSDNKGTENIGTRDWFGEILSNDGMRDGYKSAKPSALRLVGMGSTELKIIEKIYKSLPKDANGKVDPKAVYDSFMANDGKYFSKEEKAFFDDVMAWKQKNLTTKQKAANEMNGSSFKEIPFHMMRVRLDRGAKQISPTAEGGSGTVRIEAGTGKERSSQRVGPIMTNFEQIFTENLEQTGRNYYLQEAINDINNTLAVAKKDLKGEKVGLINTISGTISEALNFEFDKTDAQVLFKGLLAARAAETLFNPIRTAIELTSAIISYPFRAKTPEGYRALFGKQGQMKKLLEFTDSPIRLRDNINKAIDISDGKIKPKNKFEKAVNYLSGLPERTMLITSWMPTFNNEFKEITGEKFDINKFNSNEKYRQKYGKAIKEAAAVADAQTEKIIGSTTKAGGRRDIRIAPKILANVFGLEGKVKKNTNAGQILGFFSNYPFREITEFFNGFREAAEVYRQGDKLKAISQLQKPLGVVLNVAAYGYLSAIVYATKLMLLGDEEDEKKGEAMLKELLTFGGFMEEFQGNAISLAASKYAAGGRALLQIGATIAYESTSDEAQKAKIKKILKNSVFLDTLPVEKAQGYGGQKEILSAVASYVPQFVLGAKRWEETLESIGEIKNIYKKFEEGGLDALSEDDGSKILGIGILIKSVQLGLNIGMGVSLPMYNDIKMYMRGVKKEAGVGDIKIATEEEGKISKEDAYKNYKTLEEFQLADPEGYDEYSKDGGLLDQYRKQQREKKEENKSEKEKELDVKYGRLPFKENSMREEAMQGYSTIEQMKEENPDLYDQLSEEGGALYNLRQHEKRMKELRENALGGYGSEADFKALNPTKYEKYISEGGLLYKYNKIKQVFKADASEKMSEAQYKRRYPKEYRENYGSGSNYQLESYDRKAKKRADEREKMKEARSYGY